MLCDKKTLGRGFEFMCHEYPLGVGFGVKPLDNKLPIAGRWHLSDELHSASPDFLFNKPIRFGFAEVLVVSLDGHCLDLPWILARESFPFVFFFLPGHFIRWFLD